MLISDILRKAIAAHDEPAHAIARLAGVPESSLSRFLRRQQGLSLDTVDRLGQVLGLTLTPTAKRRARR